MKKQKQLLQQKITIRNFVAKHAPKNGAGVHADKKRQAKTGFNKHKSQIVADLSF